MDADGRHSALFACIAELFQHLDIEVICSAWILLATELTDNAVEQLISLIALSRD